MNLQAGLIGGVTGMMLVLAWMGLSLAWIVLLERRRPADAPRVPGHVYPLVPGLMLLVWSQVEVLPAPLQDFVARALLMALSMWGLLTLVWLLGTLLRNHSIMDIAYPLAPWSAMVVAWWGGGGDTSAHTLALVTCVTLWSWRLAAYIGRRYLPHGEEARYARWRARGGSSWWWWSYFQIHLTQGVFVWIWSWPMALALGTTGQLSAWGWLGLLAWATGYAFQVFGDAQMHRFRTDPSTKGQVMDRGLWAWSRHPNYFGEAMMWLGYGLLALAAPWGWLGLPCVALVFWFMNQGSAARMTERYMLKSRPAYAEYMARVPAFFPRPPRSRR
jgi:steroid 5-alpha reductase family enzyme